MTETGREIRLAETADLRSQVNEKLLQALLGLTAGDIDGDQPTH